MMGNEMNFLNQHLQTTSVLLQKQLDLARDSLHAFSAQFGRKRRIFFNKQIPTDIFLFLFFRFEENDSTVDRN